MDSQNLYTSFDLLQLGLLPKHWAEQITELVDKFAKFVHLDGRSSTSREPENTTGSDYHVVTGDVICNQLHWLCDLYQTKLAELASQVAGAQMISSSDLKWGININTLRGISSRYEWHVDSNPITGLLYVTTHTPEDGGELVFRLQDTTVSVYPKSGLFIAFDARDIPHAVMPLKRDQVRISIPMNFYYFNDQSQSRPSDVDAYIYGTTK